MLRLSRAASARFIRVSKGLVGGEEELAELLEPVLEKLFQGELYEADTRNPSGGHVRLGDLEDITLAAVGAKMRGEGA